MCLHPSEHQPFPDYQGVEENFPILMKPATMIFWIKILSFRQRIAMLTKLCAPLKLEGKFDFHQIAHNTPGYVAADLVSLVCERFVRKCSILK